jgi:3-deoxy-manno-octulosonate cytidylyltransferase (CMP-KDO synthetase)
MSDYLILIPARFASVRFPGKPLAKINNIPMIEYVARNCQNTGFDYAVVTDNDQIEKFVRSISANVVRVDDNVETGSERIALAYQRFFAHKNYKYVINVQGDEPLLQAEEIVAIANFHNDHPFDICTAVKKRDSLETDFHNPNVVKAVYSEITHDCLYFSRASIPFSRDGLHHKWYQHIGIYSYKVEALLRFVATKSSALELLEKLEQLRALENGMSIGAKLTDITLIGVDTPEDIHKIEGVFREQKI